MKYNVLTEPLILCETNGGDVSLSLPEVMAAMACDEVRGFRNLRPHQRPAWHMFLVQLGALAAWKYDADKPMTRADDWRKALRLLTPDFSDDAPWHLVVEDRSLPALLQPSVPKTGAKKWDEWNVVTTPDNLDMLVTAKNHDVKREIVKHAAPDDWLFALVSVQTMDGYASPGKYYIARMNGGASSRVMLAMVPADTKRQNVNPSAWWSNDVRRLVNRRVKGIKTPPCKVGGMALVWLEPWREKQQLAVKNLDPLFIEVCRRIRLVEFSSEVHAKETGTNKARVDSKELNGALGDPWAPVHKTENKSLSLSKRDFTYSLMHDLLFSGYYEVPFLAEAEFALEVSGDAVLIAEAFARTQSKTHGFKSRQIFVPRRVKESLFSPYARDIAQEQIESIQKAGGILMDALALIAAKGEGEPLRGKDRGKLYAHANPARAKFERDADLLFFPSLWSQLRVRDGSEEEKARAGSEFLLKIGQAADEAFKEYVSVIPCPAVFRYKAEAVAQAVFYGKMRRNDFLKKDTKQDVAA